MDVDMNAKTRKKREKNAKKREKNAKIYLNSTKMETCSHNYNFNN